MIKEYARAESPVDTWPKGKKQKEMGYTTLVNGLQGLIAVSMMVFTRAFGWSAEEVEAYLVDVRKDMHNSESSFVQSEKVC